MEGNTGLNVTFVEFIDDWTDVRFSRGIVYSFEIPLTSNVTKNTNSLITHICQQFNKDETLQPISDQLEIVPENPYFFGDGLGVLDNDNLEDFIRNGTYINSNLEVHVRPLRTLNGGKRRKTKRKSKRKSKRKKSRRTF